jgi:hypothetical protein
MIVWDDEFFSQFKNLKILAIGTNRFINYYDNPALEEEICNHFNPNNFYRQYYDVILNQRYCHSAEIDMIKYMPKTRYFYPVNLPIITWFTESWNDKRLPKLREFSSKLSISISGLFGKVVTMSEFDKECLIEFAKTYFSFSAQNKLFNNTIVIPPAVRWDFIDSNSNRYLNERKIRRSKNIFNIFHGGTLEAKRRLPLIGRVVKNMNNRGKINVNLILKTQAEKRDKKLENVANIEYGVNRQRFIESLGEGDIGICLSEFEGTGLAYLEMARSGMPMIFWNEKWLNGRLPNDYKYLVKSEKDLETALWLIIKNYDEALKESERLVKFQDKIFDAKIVAGKMFDLFNSAVNEVRNSEREYVRKMLGWNIIKNSIGKMPESFTIDFVYDFMKKNSRKGFDFKKILGPMALRRLLLEYGYVDLCDNEYPIFKFK